MHGACCPFHSVDHCEQAYFKRNVSGRKKAGDKALKLCGDDDEQENGDSFQRMSPNQVLAIIDGGHGRTYSTIPVVLSKVEHSTAMHDEFLRIQHELTKKELSVVLVPAIR